MDKEWVQEILGTSVHHAQSCIRSVVYVVVEHMMFDLACKEVIPETLDAHAEKMFDRSAATEGLLNILLALCSFMAPIVTISGMKGIQQWKKVHYRSWGEGADQYSTDL